MGIFWLFVFAWGLFLVVLLLRRCVFDSFLWLLVGELLFSSLPFCESFCEFFVCYWRCCGFSFHAGLFPFLFFLFGFWCLVVGFVSLGFLFVVVLEWWLIVGVPLLASNDCFSIVFVVVLVF